MEHRCACGQKYDALSNGLGLVSAGDGEFVLSAGELIRYNDGNFRHKLLPRYAVHVCETQLQSLEEEIEDQSVDGDGSGEALPELVEGDQTEKDSGYVDRVGMSEEDSDALKQAVIEERAHRPKVAGRHKRSPAKRKGSR